MAGNSMRVKCDNCGVTLKAKVEHAGRRMPCPKCRHQLLIKAYDEPTDIYKPVVSPQMADQTVPLWRRSYAFAGYGAALAVIVLSVVYARQNRPLQRLNPPPQKTRQPKKKKHDNPAITIHTPEGVKGLTTALLVTKGKISVLCLFNKLCKTSVFKEMADDVISQCEGNMEAMHRMCLQKFGTMCQIVSVEFFTEQCAYDLAVNTKGKVCASIYQARQWILTAGNTDGPAHFSWLPDNIGFVKSRTAKLQKEYLASKIEFVNWNLRVIFDMQGLSDSRNVALESVLDMLWPRLHNVPPILICMQAVPEWSTLEINAYYGSRAKYDLTIKRDRVMQLVRLALGYSLRMKSYDKTLRIIENKHNSGELTARETKPMISQVNRERCRFMRDVYRECKDLIRQ